MAPRLSQSTALSPCAIKSSSTSGHAHDLLPPSLSIPNYNTIQRLFCTKLDVISGAGGLPVIDHSSIWTIHHRHQLLNDTVIALHEPMLHPPYSSGSCPELRPGDRQQTPLSNISCYTATFF